jgi:hypothetical protein
MFSGTKTPTGTYEKPKSGFASGNVINTPNTGKFGDVSGSGSNSQNSSRAMSIYFSDTPSELEKYDKSLISVKLFS